MTADISENDTSWLHSPVVASSSTPPSFLRIAPASTGLESDLRKFTWHRDGPIDERSDVVVLVAPSLSGEGSDSDMPTPIWDQIIDACRTHLGEAAGQSGHYMVRLTNLAE